MTSPAGKAGAKTIGGPAEEPAQEPAQEPAPRERLGEADRLRRDIDSGRTGDKVGVSDPAAAPLGTDAESAEAHDEAGLRVAREAGKKRN